MANLTLFKKPLARLINNMFIVLIYKCSKNMLARSHGKLCQVYSYFISSTRYPQCTHSNHFDYMTCTQKMCNWSVVFNLLLVFIMVFECKPMQNWFDLFLLLFLRHLIYKTNWNRAMPLSNFILSRYTMHNCCVTARI